MDSTALNKRPFTDLVPLLFCSFDFFNFFEAVQPAAVYPRASPGRLIPRVGVRKVARPEGPVYTLPRPHRINQAALFASDFLQKYTVLARALFDNRPAEACSAQVFFAEFLDGDVQKFGDSADFIFCHPDVTFARPGAAPPALHTLEVQPADIPWRFFP